MRVRFCLAGRADFNTEEYQICGSYVVNDQKDKSKTKYVMKIVDLEKLNNLSEFIVSTPVILPWPTRSLLLSERYSLVQTIEPPESDAIARLFSGGDQTSSRQAIRFIRYVVDHLLSASPAERTFPSLRFLCRSVIVSSVRHSRTADRSHHVATPPGSSLSPRSAHHASVGRTPERHRSSFALSSGISSRNIYLCEDGRVLLDNFSHCISMISPFDGKLRRQIYDFTDDLKDELLYLAPEIIFQVSTKPTLRRTLAPRTLFVCRTPRAITSKATFTV